LRNTRLRWVTAAGAGAVEVGKGVEKRVHGGFLES
jgi:hypothetical protein